MENDSDSDSEVKQREKPRRKKAERVAIAAREEGRRQSGMETASERKGRDDGQREGEAAIQVAELGKERLQKAVGRASSQGCDRSKSNLCIGEVGN